MRSKVLLMMLSAVASTELSMRSLKKAISSGHCSSTEWKMYLRNSSARSMLPTRSQKARSGSTIQNSARWREVLEFSARKVGPKVYTSVKAMAMISASSWPLTVR